MNILLLSMPDSFEHTPSLTMRMPNGALASLAGNVDPHHRVAIADLVLVQRRVRETVSGSCASIEPDVVGLSVMTFQRHTALEHRRGSSARCRPTCADRRRRLRPEPGAGGLRAARPPASTSSFAARATSRSASCCARSSRRPAGRGDSPACRTATADAFRHDSATARSAASSDGASRCRTAPRGCSTATRSSAGRSTSSRPRAAAPTTAASARSSRCAAATSTPGQFDRVLADIADARARGARAIFIVDDNITLNVARFEALCQAIVDAGLNDIDYIVQAMTSAIAQPRRRRWRR